MSSPRDPRKKSRKKNEPPRFQTPWFWWIVAIVCSACFAALSWTGVDYLFAFPEKKQNYSILERVNRTPTLPELKGRDAPEGITLQPIPIYSQFSSLEDGDQNTLNTLLRRQLASGLTQADLIYYVEGDYEILEIRDLTEDDLISPGFAVKAQATIRPDEFRPAVRYPLFLEYILPNAKEAQKAFYPAGSIISLKKFPGFCTVIHTQNIFVDRDPHVVITALPIVKGAQKTPDGQNIRTSLPETINVTGTLPLWTYE